MLDDLRHFKDRQDSFALFDSETAGAILGAIVAALVVGGLGRQFIEWLVAL